MNSSTDFNCAGPFVWSGGFAAAAAGARPIALERVLLVGGQFLAGLFADSLPATGSPCDADFDRRLAHRSDHGLISA